MNDQDEQQYDNVFRDQLCKLKLDNRELKETISELQQQIKNKCKEIAYLKSVVANPRRNQRTKSASISESVIIETSIPPKATTTAIQTSVSTTDTDTNAIGDISKSFKMRLLLFTFSIFQ